MNHHSRYDVSQRKRCDVPQEVPHGDNLLYGRRTPRRTHYTARPLMTRRTFSPPPPPPSPRYRSRHHNHKGNRRRAPFPLRPFAGVPAAPPARSQIDAYSIGRRRSCEFIMGSPPFMQGSRRATPRQEGLSSGLLTLIPPDARYPPRERRLMPEWDIRLAGKACLRLAIFARHKVALSSFFCGCTLLPSCHPAGG